MCSVYLFLQYKLPQSIPWNQKICCWNKKMEMPQSRNLTEPTVCLCESYAVAELAHGFLLYSLETVAVLQVTLSSFSPTVDKELVVCWNTICFLFPEPIFSFIVFSNGWKSLWVDILNRRMALLNIWGILKSRNREWSLFWCEHLCLPGLSKAQGERIVHLVSLPGREFDAHELFWHGINAKGLASCLCLANRTEPPAHCSSGTC